MMAKNTRSKDRPFTYYPKENKYYRWYMSIIEKAKPRGLPKRRDLNKQHGFGVYEYHHIISECPRWTRYPRKSSRAHDP